MSMPVFYSQMGHLSISSAAFCRYLHISFLVLYISEKVPVAYYFAYKSGVIALVPLSFLVLLYRMRNASYTKHHTPNSALRALCFPPTGPPFSHWPKKNTRLSFTLHRISSLLERLAALSSTPLSPTPYCSVLRFVRRYRLRLESISLSGAKIMQGTKIRRKRKPLAPYLVLFHLWLHRWCAVGITVLRSISPG